MKKSAEFPLWQGVIRLATRVTICVLVLLGPWASAQNKVPTSTDGSDPSKWDRKLDGLIAATHNHKLIFESDVIRVSSVTVFAGAEEPYHLHPYYSVLVLEPGGGRSTIAISTASRRLPCSSPGIHLRPSLFNRRKRCIRSRILVRGMDTSSASSSRRAFSPQR